MKIRDILKEYCLNSTLHGAKFIADENYKISERIFWFCCICMAWFASALLILASLAAFRTNAISFVVETSHKDWDTQFPAVVICETKNMDRVQLIADSIWGADHDFLVEEVLSEIGYFRGESYHTVNICGGDDPDENCFYGNFSYYAKIMRSGCNDTIANCVWNDVEFNCCEYFHPMETEIGICYAINSKQIIDESLPRLNMVSNKYTGPGKLSMEVLSESYVYILGEDDVPTLITPKSDVLQVDNFIGYKRLISIRNVKNDPETKDTYVEQRNCRFDYENPADVHKYYSYSVCSVQCRKNAQMELCNCTSHLMPNTDQKYHCGMVGITCLNEYFDEWSTVIPSWSTGKVGIVCDCLPSCTEVDISVVHEGKESIYESDRVHSTVEIGLVGLPTERYMRKVVRGRLDLVVSMGGTTGLFVGASLLSFVEIIYFLIIRPYGSYYMRTQRK